jgi:hypothetical protein
MREIFWLAEVTVASQELLCFVEVAYLVVFYFYVALRPNAGHGPLFLEVF